MEHAHGGRREPEERAAPSYTNERVTSRIPVRVLRVHCAAASIMSRTLQHRPPGCNIARAYRNSDDDNDARGRRLARGGCSARVVFVTGGLSFHLTAAAAISPSVVAAISPSVAAAISPSVFAYNTEYGCPEVFGRKKQYIKALISCG